MKLTFFSNFMNHHQLFLCNEFFRMKGVEFCFVATEKINEERLRLGYEDLNYNTPYVLREYENNEKVAMNLAINSDVVIFGSAPEKYLHYRMRYNKLTFRYSERIFKKSKKVLFHPMAWYTYYRNHIRYRNKELYLLCASAYAAEDYNFIGAYHGKCFKWGYFPELKKYQDINTLFNNKKSTNMKVFWCGRFLNWKHPETMILLAEKMKAYPIHFKMVGTGPLEEQLSNMIKEKELDNIEIMPSQSASDIRKLMELSDIYLFSSDEQEGWGAVLNEAMNSGCAVLASCEAGATNYLIKDGYNGIKYHYGDIPALTKKLMYLYNNPDEIKRLGYNAYRTIIECWNYQKAAENFMELVKSQNKDLKDAKGPCEKDG